MAFSVTFEIKSPIGVWSDHPMPDRFGWLADGWMDDDDILCYAILCSEVQQKVQIHPKNLHGNLVWNVSLFYVPSSIHQKAVVFAITRYYAKRLSHQTSVPWSLLLASLAVQTFSFDFYRAIYFATRFM
jgi:hypothetical protein